METTLPTEQPAAAEVVSRVLADDQQFTPENRSDHREPLVIPAQILQPKFELTLNGFVRNISTGGVCLIAPQPYRQGAEATILLIGQGAKIESTATCRWGANFGNSYWLSGWQLNSNLPVGQMLKEDLQVEPEQRGGSRVTTAIPIYITPANSSVRIQGFTRNLSRDGICLVSKIETAVGQVATLEVMQLTGEFSPIASRCMWSKRYGDEHWVSGWGFDV